jgi:hypothetical protein
MEVFMKPDYKQMTDAELRTHGSLIFKRGHEIANGTMGVVAFA